jgi:CRISPR system Cascade subunit CasE
MFLSKLTVNIGEDPTRYRPARQWLHNLYRVHQRLWMAFPDGPAAQSGDPPSDSTPDYPFFPERLPTPEQPKSQFLFRIELTRPTVILVQSSLEPDWRRAFWNAEYLLDPRQPYRVIPYDPATLIAHRRLSFRLLANAVFRARETSKHSGGTVIHQKWIGKCIGISSDETSLRNWIERRVEPGWSDLKGKPADACRPGFRLEKLSLMQPGWAWFNKTGKTRDRQRLRSVRYEGILEITDASAFRKTLSSGIGPAKAFGFGLLSIAPLRANP